MTDFPSSYPTFPPTDSSSFVSSSGKAAVLFIMFGIALGAITDYILHIIHFPVPYVAFVFFEGIALASILKETHAGDAINEVQSSDVAPNLILYVFLPVLLYGEVMNLNWHNVKGGFNQSLLLAGPCALFSALLTAGVAQAVWPGWRQPVLYFVFGAILCATDPVSVVALLKSTGASSKLTIVIVGESLMNDGTAMILFFYFLETLNGVTYTAASFFEFVGVKLGASPTVGLAIGVISVFLMKRFYQVWNITDMNIQVAITVVAAYSSFFIAEYDTLIGGSGVLSCCGAGLMVAWLSSPKILGDHYMHEVWGKLEWTCNTLIFLLGGLVAGGKTITEATGMQFAYLVVLYLLLTVIRMFLVALVYPVLSTIGLKCSRNDAIFMAFAGIRGALAIALALQVKANKRVTQKDGDQFYFFVCGIAAISLLVNGTLAEPLVRLLGLVEDPTKPKSPEMLFVLEQVKRRIRRSVREEVERMREELGSFNQDEVRRLCRLMRGSKVGDDNYQISMRNMSKISPDLLAYVRETFLETVRARYWDSIMSGKVGTQSFSSQLLLYSLDRAKDTIHDPLAPLGDWELVEKSLNVADPTTMALAKMVDSWCARMGYYPGWVNYLDSLTERRAIYVLSNFIDGHTFAQSRLHMFLGAPERDYGDVCPEENAVMQDSTAAVNKAKYLLRLIKEEHLQAFYNHRTARVVLVLQREMIDHMVSEGSLSHKLAEAFLGEIEDDDKEITIEREKTHRKILKETYRNKVNEEIARNSVDSLSGDDLGMSTTPGTGNPVFRMGLRQQLESDIARKSSFNDNFVDAGVPGGPRV